MPGVRPLARSRNTFLLPLPPPHVWVRIQKERGVFGSGLRGSNPLLLIPGGEGGRGRGGGEGEVEEEEELAADLLGCIGRKRMKEPKRSILEAEKMIGRTKQHILVLHRGMLEFFEICAMPTILLWFFSFP